MVPSILVISNNHHYSIMAYFLISLLVFVVFCLLVASLSPRVVAAPFLFYFGSTGLTSPLIMMLARPSHVPTCVTSSRYPGVYLL